MVCSSVLCTMAAGARTRGAEGVHLERHLGALGAGEPEQATGLAERSGTALSPRAHPWQKGPPQKESWYTHRPLMHLY
jgi:hypothetical protein